MKKSLSNVINFGKQKEKKEQEDVIEEMVRTELINRILKDDEHFVELVIWAAVHKEEILSVDLDSKELLLLNNEDMYLEFTSEKTAKVITASLAAWKDRHDLYEEMCKTYEEKMTEKYPEEEMENFKKDIEEKVKPMPLDQWTRQLARFIVAEDELSRDFIKNHARQMKCLNVYLDTEYAPQKN